MTQVSFDRIRLELGKSSCLTAVLAFLHAGGFFCLWWAGLPAVVQITAALVVVGSCVRSLRLYGFRVSAEAVVFVAWEREGQWRVQTRARSEYFAELVDPAFAHPVFTVLTLRQVGSRRRRHVLICADAADPDQFRRLRVRLRNRTPADSGMP